jgi:hypothetical protein
MVGSNNSLLANSEELEEEVSWDHSRLDLWDNNSSSSNSQCRLGLADSNSSNNDQWEVTSRLFQPVNSLVWVVVETTLSSIPSRPDSDLHSPAHRARAV